MHTIHTLSLTYTCNARAHVAKKKKKSNRKQDNIEVVKKLVDAGADPGKADKSGNTPMHAAAGEGAMAVVTYFVEIGLPLVKNEEGFTPLVISRLAGLVRRSGSRGGGGGRAWKSDEGDTEMMQERERGPGGGG